MYVLECGRCCCCCCGLLDSRDSICYADGHLWHEYRFLLILIHTNNAALIIQSTQWYVGWTARKEWQMIAFDVNDKNDVSKEQFMYIIWLWLAGVFALVFAIFRKGEQRVFRMGGNKILLFARLLPLSVPPPPPPPVLLLLLLLLTWPFCSLYCFSWLEENRSLFFHSSRLFFFAVERKHIQTHEQKHTAVLRYILMIFGMCAKCFTRNDDDGNRKSKYVS